MPELLPSTLITWQDVYSLCRELTRQLWVANIRIDMIVAIARGGYIPGRILSDMLGVGDLAGFKIEHYQGTRKQQDAFVKYPLNADINGKNVLLLDDVCDTGDTFVVALEHIRQCGTVNELHTAALHFKTISRFVPDFYAETVREWRWIIYPWAVNEDLSSMIAKIRTGNADKASLQRLIKDRHGIDVTFRQIEDALMLLENKKSTDEKIHPRLQNS